MTDTSQTTPSLPARRLKAPSWLDVRLLTGVMLVVASVAIGASVLSSADHRQSRWALAHDLAAGTIVTGADLKPVRVQLGSADSLYLPVSEAVVGRTVRASMRAGQLLPRAALTAPEQGVAVTIPLRADNLPGISQGDRIVLWVSTKTCKAVVVLSGVPVQSAQKAGGSSFAQDSGWVLVVRIPAVDAKRVVTALDLDGAVIRAGILSDGQQPDPVAADLSACGGVAK